LLVPQVTHDPLLARSWTSFAVIVAGMVASAGYVPFSQVLLWARRPAWHTVMIGCTLALAGVLTLTLVAAFGALGAALATALAYVGAMLLIRLFSARVLRLRI
jgi:Na+-driven multidrug efflux pump